MLAQVPIQTRVEAVVIRLTSTPTTSATGGRNHASRTSRSRRTGSARASNTSTMWSAADQNSRFSGPVSMNAASGGPPRTRSVGVSPSCHGRVLARFPTEPTTRTRATTRSLRRAAMNTDTSTSRPRNTISGQPSARTRPTGNGPGWTSSDVGAAGTERVDAERLARWRRGRARLERAERGVGPGLERSSVDGGHDVAVEEPAVRWQGVRRDRQDRRAVGGPVPVVDRDVRLLVRDGEPGPDRHDEDPERQDEHRNGQRAPWRRASIHPPSQTPIRGVRTRIVPGHRPTGRGIRPQRDLGRLDRGAVSHHGVVRGAAP